jgi:hypothetical protein
MTPPTPHHPNHKACTALVLRRYHVCVQKRCNEDDLNLPGTRKDIPLRRTRGSLRQASDRIHNQPPHNRYRRRSEPDNDHISSRHNRYRLHGASLHLTVHRIARRPRGLGPDRFRDSGLIISSKSPTHEKRSHSDHRTIWQRRYLRRNRPYTKS